MSPRTDSTPDQRRSGGGRGSWASELRSESGERPSGGDGPIWRGVERAINNALLQRVGRVGWVAKGLVYALLGVLMFRIAIHAVGSGDEEASPTGAIDAIAQSGFGSSLLSVLSVGLVLFAAWRLVTAFLPGDLDVESLLKRAAYLFSAATYGVLAWIAIGEAAGRSSSSGDATTRIIDTMMTSGTGRVVLGLVGVGSVVIAAYFVRKGVTRSYREQLSMDGATDAERAVVDRLGVVGWIARAVVVLLVGLFFIDAGFLNDPENAKGIDAILTEVVAKPWGTPLVYATGVGLVLYGIFCIVSARHRVLRAP